MTKQRAFWNLKVTITAECYLEEEKSTDSENNPDGESQREHYHQQRPDGQVHLRLQPGAVVVVPGLEVKQTLS